MMYEEKSMLYERMQGLRRTPVWHKPEPLSPDTEADTEKSFLPDPSLSEQSVIRALESQPCFARASFERANETPLLNSSSSDTSYKNDDEPPEPGEEEEEEVEDEEQFDYEGEEEEEHQDEGEEQLEYEEEEEEHQEYQEGWEHEEYEGEHGMSSDYLNFDQSSSDAQGYYFKGLWLPKESATVRPPCAPLEPRKSRCLISPSILNKTEDKEDDTPVTPTITEFPPSQPVVVATRTSKNLLAGRKFSPKAPHSRLALVPLPSTDIQPIEVESEETRIRREENELLYARYKRAVLLDKDSQGRIETWSRLEEVDRSMTRKEITVERIQEVRQEIKCRASSHNGRWRFKESKSRKREGEKSKKDRRPDPKECKDLAMLGSIGKRTNSVYTFDSQTGVESEQAMMKEVKEHNLLWRRGFVIRSMLVPLSNGDSTKVYELEVFTLRGRLFVKTCSGDNFGSLRVKFAKLEGDMYIVRRSSYSSSCLFSINLRIGKTMKINSTAIVAYKHPKSRMHWMMWCDDIGLIYVTKEEAIKYDNDIRRKLPLMVPMRIVTVKMQAEHFSDATHYMDPRRWLVKEISEMVEESDMESLHDTAWPRLAQRIDDLKWEKMEGQTIHLHSPSFPERKIRCSVDQWVRGEKDETDKSYRRYQFTAIIVPYDPIHSSNKWTCLVMAPLVVIAAATEGRIYNYRPLNHLVAARERSLQKGWRSDKENVSFPIFPYDTESR
ncbi:hypothetical protein PFISCL1PPCAC_15817 [Pristionchus fissidentatus]|uniref:Uncharacterized protein n=1 Tax=Pristionchus fissidentatus TaxID=1538716 RepID=A0AAV5W1C2_9BILA|nr:hypothetical protein PFISCL1PPCAC_15817 [Pristionchus fissidentatus]